MLFHACQFPILPNHNAANSDALWYNGLVDTRFSEGAEGMNRKRAPELRRTAHISSTVTTSQKERIRAAAYTREQIPADFVRTVVLEAVEKIEKEQARQQRGTK